MPTVDLGPCECCGGDECCWAEIASISFDFRTLQLPSLTISCSDWCHASKSGQGTLSPAGSYGEFGANYMVYEGSTGGGMTVTGSGACVPSQDSWAWTFIFSAWCRGMTPTNGQPFRHWEAYFYTLPRGGYQIRPDDCENTGEKYLSDFQYPAGAMHGVLPTLNSCTDLHGYTVKEEYDGGVSGIYVSELSITFNGLP